MFVSLLKAFKYIFPHFLSPNSEWGSNLHTGQSVLSERSASSECIDGGWTCHINVNLALCPPLTQECHHPLCDVHYAQPGFSLKVQSAWVPSIFQFSVRSTDACSGINANRWHPPSRTAAWRRVLSHHHALCLLLYSLMFVIAGFLDNLCMLASFHITVDIHIHQHHNHRLTLPIWKGLFEALLQICLPCRPLITTSLCISFGVGHGKDGRLMVQHACKVSQLYLLTLKHF